MEFNGIGLETEKANEIAAELNKLLANYQQFYMNLRGFHWNVKGTAFFELHLKFEELYNDINLKVDEIAERILALDNVPLHSFTAYQNNATIKEEHGLTNGKDMVRSILSSFKELIIQQRSILEKAGEINDEGSVSLMSDYITEEEKTVWMLKAYLG